MAIRSFIARHPTGSYLGLAFGITWAGILAATAPSGIPGRGETVARLLPLVFLLMLAGPSLAGIGLTGLVDGRAGLRALAERLGRWRVGLSWYAVALLTTPLLLAVILGGLALVSPVFLPAIVTAGDPLPVVALALVFGLAAGFFEELGWTGFVLPRLLDRHHPLIAGLLLGLVWAVWHLLADYWGGAEAYGSLYLPHFLQWVVGLTAYRILITWVYVHTRSLLLAQLMHAGFTGGQALLGPVAVSAAEGVLWYALFAAALWAVVAIVVAAGGLAARPLGPLRPAMPAV